MTKQFSIEDEEMYEPIITENNLTPRQWHLYNFIKWWQDNDKPPFKNQEMLLESYEIWVEEHGAEPKYLYGYWEETHKHYSDMTSGRNLRTDLKALRADPTIQKVICANKIADTVEEAEVYLKKQLAKVLRELKLYHTQKKKLEKHLQTRLVFNQEREIIEAVRGLEE